MQFTITNEHTFSWPVTMKVPDPKRAGVKVDQKFTALFRYMPRSEALAMQQEFLALTDQAARDQHEHDLIRRVLIGWGDDVVDDNKEKVEFSEAALDMALELHWFREGVYTAYQKAITNEGGRRGN